MIDHVLGRPSVKFRKIQVLAVVSFWSLYLYKGDRHGPPLLRRISSLVSPRLTAWQTILTTLLYLYVARNFGKLLSLECPEPLANLYSRPYFRATWITTALDAGFWSAMRIRRKGLRDVLSIIFSLYYMICAEQADEKVRKIRATLTVDHLRVSWNKGTTTYLHAITRLLRPRLMWWEPLRLRIHRPKASAYDEPINAWLYYNGPRSAMLKETKIILDISGGGFVAMTPRNHDDKLMGWAGKTNIPIVSLDYRKAPEWPYPYALNECYDAYHSVVVSKGRCIGLSGDELPQIVVTGDSAGGNLAVGMVLMILQAASTESRRWHDQEVLPAPAGVVLMYPALDMNIGNWMTDEQMALIRDRRSRKQNKSILRHKSNEYRQLAPNTPGASDRSDSEEESPQKSQSPRTGPAAAPASERVLTSPQTAIKISAAHTGQDERGIKPKPSFHNLKASVISQLVDVPNGTASKPHPPTPAPPPTALKTRLAMSSMISYFNDRILTPEMMRAMIILYIGPHNRPDFSTDFLLSPLLAPESLLAHFPRTWMLTGERDPLVDDTVIFAGRLRQAKRARFVSGKEMGLDWARGTFDETDWVNVHLVPGVSHGFMQFVSVFPDGWKHIRKCAEWCEEAFDWDARHGDHSEHGDDSVTTTAEPTPMFEQLPGDDSNERRSRRRERTDYFGSRVMLTNGNGRATAADKHASRRRSPSPSSFSRAGTASSGEEDRPLEMTVLRRESSKSNKKTPSPPGSGSSSGRSPTKNPTSNGSPHSRDARARAGSATQRSKAGKAPSRRQKKTKDKDREEDFTSLPSEEDLLGRRMKGLTEKLAGSGADE